MAEQEGYVKIDRNMLHWGWYSTPATAHFFLTLLLKANYKEMQFAGKAIKVGQVVMSYQSISKISGLTIQQCRTALKHLKSTGEVTSESFNRYQVITIVNYDQYQNVTRLLASKQQATNKQLTSNQQQEKEYNNKANKKTRKNIPPKSPTGGLSSSEDQDESDLPKRGTEAFRRRSHILLSRDEGTVDDIPINYRNGKYASFDNFSDYWGYRNQ